jgi:hypothetical protein
MPSTPCLRQIINPLSSSCSCDARIDECQQNGLLVPPQPIQPTSTNQKRLFAPVNLSLVHFIQGYPNSDEPFLCQQKMKLTTMWCHMATMALRGLNSSTKFTMHVIKFDYVRDDIQVILIFKC